MSANPGGKRVLAMLTVIAAPFALGFETLLRKLVFPPEFEDVRTLFAPALTLAAWTLPVVCLVASLVGVVFQHRLVERALRKLPADRRHDPESQEKARVGAFLLAASVPQVPAIVATVLFTFGASLTPVLVTVAVSTLGVIAQVGRAIGTR